MRERPILFSGAMVRALLEGRKTQTRRVIKPQPPGDYLTGANRKHYFCHKDGSSRAVLNRDTSIEVYGRPPKNPIDDATWIRNPYGQPGDRLWVRERQEVIEGLAPVTERSKRIRVRYLADGAESGWIMYPDRLKGKPVIGKCLSYGGYRESSRITLEVTGVRVERVQTITDQDAIAEGALRLGAGTTVYAGKARDAFAELWDSINGPRGFGWDANPWVWVVEFKRVEGR